MKKSLLLCLGLLSIFSIWGVALSSPNGFEGTWDVKGMDSKLGSYTGTVTITKSSATKYKVKERAKFDNSSTTKKFTAYGTIQGNTLTATYTHQYTVGIVGALSGASPKYAYEKVTLVYQLNGTTIQGTYKSDKRADYKGTESLSQGGTPANNNPITVDFDVVLPNGKTLEDTKKNTDGVAIQMNVDDDDNDGGAGGDKQNNIIGDKDDKNGVAGENDLFTLKISTKEAIQDGYYFQLTFASQYVQVHKDSMKKEAVAADTKLPHNTTTLYLEGISTTPHETGTSVVLNLYNKSGTLVGSDKIKVHVAENIFLLNGHGSASSWSGSSFGRNNAIYGSNPYIIKGKDEAGKVTYYAFYSWNTEKLAKIAMSTPGAYVVYDGHSNFGMGYAFKTNFKTISEFMNIAADYVPVNWQYLREHQEHPGLMFDDSEYGDDKGTSAKFDVVQVGNVAVQGVRETTYTSRYYNHAVSGGSHLSFTRGNVKWQDHHYGSADNYRIVIKAGSGDLPAKKWRMIFLNSCYAGPYYYHTFNHGVLFYTIDEASSSATSTAWMKAIVEGKNKDQILHAINQEENINDYKDFGGN